MPGRQVRRRCRSASGTPAVGRSGGPPRSPAWSDRTLVADRKLHKFLSRTDLFGLYAADTAIQQSGLTAYRDRAGPGSVRRAVQRSERGLCRLRRRRLPAATTISFPLLTAAQGDLQAFGRELGITRQPDVAADAPAQQCALPRRHPPLVSRAPTPASPTSAWVALWPWPRRPRPSAPAKPTGPWQSATTCPIEPETVLHYHQARLAVPGCIARL